MIYNLIAEQLNNFLGGDFVISYSNNHDFKWEEVLKEAQDKIKYGVLRVDSGTTQQVGGQQVRTEQMRLSVAIPEERDVFNDAVGRLRGLIYGMNNFACNDAVDNITAILYFGEYQDAHSVVVNGQKWWIANVVFIANFYDGVIDSNDVSITFGTGTSAKELKGIMQATFTLEKTVDGYVYNNSNGIQRNSVNGIQKTLTANIIYLKNDILIHDGTNHTGLLDNEDSLTTTYTIVYNNGIKSRTLSDMMLTSVNELVVTGDILKATLVFTKGA